MTVRDVMTADLVTVGPATLMIEAATRMSNARVGSVLVMDQGQLLGIFTERDILAAFRRDRADPVRVSPVADGMTRDPATIAADASIGDALDQMLEGGFRHLPVIQDGSLVGIVSMRDLARHISKG